MLKKNSVYKVKSFKKLVSLLIVSVSMVVVGGGAFNLAPLSLSVAYGEQLTWSHSRVRSNEEATRERSTTTRTSVPDIDGSEVIFKPVLGVIGGGEITWTSGSNIYIKNLLSEEVTVLTGHTDSVTSLSYSPDGTQLASGSWDETIRLWDVATGQHIRILTGHSRGVNTVSYSPDGTQLASGSCGIYDSTNRRCTVGEIRVWDVATGQHLRTLSGHSGDVNTVSYSSDGTQLASGSWDNTIRVWDVATGRSIRTLTGHRSGVESLSYSSDGTQLASGSWDNTIRLWDVATGQHIRTLSGHRDWVLSLSYSPDGTQLVSGSCGEVTNSECTVGEILQWDVATGRPIRTLTGHGDWVLSLSYSSDGTQFASGSCGEVTNSECTVGEILLWDVVTGQEIRNLAGHGSVVESLSYSPDGTQLVSGSCVEVTDSECPVGDIRLLDVAPRQSLQQQQPSLSLSVSSARVSEGDSVTITATLSEMVNAIFDVQLATTTESTALSTDYTLQTSLTIAMGDTSATATLEILDDDIVEGDETIEVYIGSIDSALVSIGTLERDAVVVTIEDDDAPATVTLSQSESGGIRTITATLDKLLAVSIVVTVTTSDGTTLTTITIPAIMSRAESTGLGITGNVYIGSIAAASGSTLPSGLVSNGTPPPYTLTGHSEMVNSVSYSPDGTQFASGSSDNTIKIWDVATRNLLRTIESFKTDTNNQNHNPNGHSDWVRSVSYSPDGTQLASGSDDNTIKIWDVETGQHIHTFTEHSGTVYSVSYSPNGQLASGSSDDTIRLWDVSDSDPQNWSHISTLEGHSGIVSSVSYSPDGTQLASGSSDGTIRLWDVATGDHIHTFTGHSDWVSSVSYSPDGTKLASGSDDNTIRVWDILTERHLRTLTGHTSTVNSVSYSPDGYQLASGSLDINTGSGEIRLWDVFEDDPAAWSYIRTLTGHSWIVTSVSYSPDSTQLASGSLDINTGLGEIRLWDVAPGRHIRTLTGHIQDVRSVSFSPNGIQLASGSGDETIRLWDVATGREIRTLEGHSGIVSSVSYSSIDGTQLASGSYDDNIRLWDVATGQHIRTLEGHRARVLSVSYSPDGTQLASGSDDNTILLWDVVTRRHLRTLTGHTSTVNSLSYLHDGTQLASGSSDGTILLWDIATGREIHTLTGHSEEVLSVSYSPDGTQLASGSSDDTIRLWDVATGQHIRTLTGHDDNVRSVAYSLDGTQLASGSDDETIRLWNVVTGREIRALTGHSGRVRSVSYSPDGTKLASGSSDDTIRLWDVAIGQYIPQSLRLSVSSVTVSEGDSVTITATLSEVVSSEVAVTLGVTAESTAEAADYTLPSITLAANTTSATGTLEIIADDIVEGEETIEVYIESFTPTATGVTNYTPQASAITVTIEDDDVAEVRLRQSSSGGMRTITATLDKVLDVAVVVTVTTSDGMTLTTITIPANTLSAESVGLELDQDVEVYIGMIEAAPGSMLPEGLVEPVTDQNNPLPVTMFAGSGGGNGNGGNGNGGNGNGGSGNGGSGNGGSDNGGSDNGGSGNGGDVINVGSIDVYVLLLLGWMIGLRLFRSQRQV